jgi:hypothetical protein
MAARVRRAGPQVAQGITLSHIEHLRAHRWRTAPSRRISTEQGALRLISDLGFALLMPITGADLPSIHTACQRDWIWWDWKQTLPERKACYYAKVIRRRGTFISWEWFPAFYRAYADPRPYWRQYREGLLDREERQILDLLQDQGPLMTRDLRLAFAPRSKANTRRVKGVIVELQTRFLITAAGGDTSGWSHHRWDLVERWAPPRYLLAAAKLSREEACTHLLKQCVHNLVATTAADLAWIFGWPKPRVDACLSHLLSRGEVQTAALPELETDVIVPSPWPRQRSRR